MAKYTANCNFCEHETIHEYEEHLFNTQNAIEKCRYFNKSISHFLEHHKEHKDVVKFFNFERVRIYTKTILKGVIKDILGILLLPISFIVSILYKIFEWLNDRIGLFD